jgi:hypothetical protein
MKRSGAGACACAQGVAVMNPASAANNRILECIEDLAARSAVL